ISSSPATILSVVVFPQPEGPTRTTNSLSWMVMSADLTACTPPSYTLLTDLSSTVATLIPPVSLSYAVHLTATCEWCQRFLGLSESEAEAAVGKGGIHGG